MKTLLLIKDKATLLLLVLIGVGIFSCKKDSIDVEKLLTGRMWKVEEMKLQAKNSGTFYYYKAGDASSNTNRSSDFLKFNADNTGTYSYEGKEYATTWNFTNDEKTKMTLVVHYATPETLYLENMDITFSYFTYAQYKLGNDGYLASIRRVPD